MFIIFMDSCFHLSIFVPSHSHTATKIHSMQDQIQVRQSQTNFKQHSMLAQLQILSGRTL